MLRLPSQSDVAREIARNVDPNLIFRAHRQLSSLMGETLGARLEDLYDEMKPERTFAPDAAGAGRRALRNAALTLLAARGRPADRARLTQQFLKAPSMTEEAHALFLLAAQETPDREKALKRFYDRWRHDHLVIDTWFAAQAQSPLPSTLKTVKALTGDPLFSRTSPNKVRALIGHFAMQNPVQFNRPDGAGYEFVAGEVLAINAFNPQIAARMLGAFRSWRALEAGRRGHARRALQRVAKTPGLSRDVYEIVTKMLES